MLILGGIFFVFVPTVLLFTITQLGSVDAVSQLSQALEVLPEKAQAAIKGDTEPARAGYALAVYLFAPVAVVVPITISTAVGAATIVGERERGTGEFLAHSPAGIREIFLGKLAASLHPRLPHHDRRLRHLRADRQHDRRARTSAAGSSPPASGGCSCSGSCRRSSPSRSASCCACRPR